MIRTTSSAAAVAVALMLGSGAAHADYTPLIYQGAFDNLSEHSTDDGYRYTQSRRYDRRRTRSPEAAEPVRRRSTGERELSSPRRAERRPSVQRRTARHTPHLRPRAVERHARLAPAPRGGGGGSSSGVASYYWQPQRVASGGMFNPNAMTAAHRSLPFGTRVRVTNANTGRSVNVRINDRGPYVGGRIIDLSSAAAGAIGMRSAGVARVKVEVLGR